MEFPFNIIVNSEEETTEIAINFAKILLPSNIIAITGDLGTGKTFFVKAIAKYFGIDNVTSPTFSIVNTYTGKVKINHFDFYRIRKIEELYDIGFEEYLCDSSAITLIEWAEMFNEILPINIFRIEIFHLGDSKREIKIKKN
ncbi:MAG: tRNA (adenosine(37)-N6)-threonylcarbamoyltransferase complex ATPase subunit type 1 TsaE [Bacteroidetes bacterium]|nr:tRNA (adenosine(37)-N6)-threonylcarbamoyltransferase complex ATPase subunit type 1 TsaE [Bacteroidota bacterium]MBU1114228.1 tRNA (adenosine(37)-N6)-threonylcarbamoyltransferase complex ATPase subunit type 1 TsaE [Bacteroidota bacterium]MBU1797358.1 tRNA (adenosine(37)-N6)-threonylcarbamoyltransferase complex ATPase subunit type 1 TsaE [Bacteroidota bacterium]